MRNSFRSLFIILVGIVAISVILKYFVFEEGLISGIITRAILIGITFCLLLKSHFVSSIRPTRWTIFYLSLSALLIFLSYSQISETLRVKGVSVNFNTHLYFLVKCFSIGLFEELFFRIYLFLSLSQILEEKNVGIFKIVGFTSLIFGLVHFVNLLNPDFVKITVINQVLIAFSLGILFQAIYIKTRSIVFIATLHALINYFGMYKKVLLDDGSLAERNSYGLNDILLTIVSVLIVTILFVLPVSYWLIKTSEREKL